jgi:hypothetical protein
MMMTPDAKMKGLPGGSMIPGYLLRTGKAAIPVLLLATLLSGFRASCYSLDHLQSCAPPIVLTLLLAWLGGAALGPALLSWLPGKSLPLKGLMAGFLALTAWPAACLPLHLEPLDMTMAILIIPAMSSLLTTRLAGAPPNDWRKPAPLQVAPIALAAGIWIMARFI